MVESNQTPNNADQSNSDEINDRPYGDMYWVYIIGAWSLVGLLLVAIFWPGMVERLKFFVATLWVLVTAFAVIAQAIIYRKQWEVMQEQKRIMTIGERAYLGIKDAKLVNPIVDNTMVVHVKLFNGGRTPAINIERKFMIGLIGKKGIEALPWAKYPAMSETDLTILPAGAERWLTFPHVPITVSKFKEFEEGKRIIRAAGQIRFSDFMGSPQIFEFEMCCEFRDNGSFKETYQRQYDDR